MSEVKKCPWCYKKFETGGELITHLGQEHVWDKWTKYGVKDA